MPETVQGLIDAVKNEAPFDESDTMVLGWLNRRHRRMVARARAYVKSATLTTVADQRDYALPADLVEVREVTVNGLPYGRARHTDLAQGAQGWLLLDGEGGVVAPEESDSGALELALYPTPSDGGLTILLRAAFLPADLSTSDNTTIRVPGDLIDALIAGAVATGLLRTESRPDLAQYHEQLYQEGTEEWRRQVARRFRGPGPSTIRILGVNA